MSTATPLYIGLSGIARLAGVQRPVASAWRNRFAKSEDPFPAPMKEQNGRPIFDALDVARWLERTEHGNNADVVADVAASAAPTGFDITDENHVDAVDALLTLRAASGRSVGGHDASELAARARLVDPDDEFLGTELEQAEPAWAEWADVLADAAYSPEAAARILEKRHAATRSAAGSAGPLSAEGDDLLIVLTAALFSAAPAELDLGGGIEPALATHLLHAIGEDAEVALDRSRSGRSIRRRLLCGEVQPTIPENRGDGPRLNILRLPTDGTSDTSAMLRQLDDLTLSLAAQDRAVVIAPSGVLADVLAGVDDGIRAQMLRSGRVRAVARLGAGLVTTAPREALALWVLGPPVGDLPIADRYTAVADLTDVALTSAARADLASDVLASMGNAGQVRAHAFRFARLVRTTSLLASRHALVATVTGGARHPRLDERDLPALIDQARDALGADAPLTLPRATRAAAVPAIRIEALLAEGHLRAIPGTRVDESELSRGGLIAVTIDDLDDPQRVGERRIDPLEFAAQHPSARLTSPGDIVFRTSPTPRAWVDVDGSKVVVYPARVLRIDLADPGGLVPEVVAADIDRSTGGPGSWRRWTLRRVAPGAITSLRAALGDIAAQREELTRRLDALDRYSDLLTAGVVSGVVTLTDPAADAASEMK